MTEPRSNGIAEHACPPLHRQLLRFGIVGAIGAAVDIGGTMLLLGAGWSPHVARLPAFAAAIVTTWALHGIFTFERAASLTPASFARFFSVALAAAGFNYLVYAALVFAGAWPPAAILGATCISMGGSYVAYRTFAFR